MSNTQAVGPASVTALIAQAQADGLLSKQSLNVLKAADIGPQIQAGMGIPVQNFKSTQGFLVVGLYDDSTSILGIPNGPDSICKGQNLYVDAFTHSKQIDSVLMATWLLNSQQPLHPFVEMKDVVRLVNGKNYHATGGTPLYRMTSGVLGALALKMQVEYADAGYPCLAYLLVVTDGFDEDYTGGRKKFKASDCRTLVEDMGESLIFQFMGIGGNSNVNFRAIAQEMGAQDKHIMTPDATEHEIRESFRLASQTAVRASQNAQSFSQARLGGLATV